MRKMKRVVALVLSAVMILGLFPDVAKAAEAATAKRPGYTDRV